MTRGGKAIESVWLSFPESAARHDTRYAGENFRERERIKRKKERWARRFAAMSLAERAAVRAALDDVDQDFSEPT
jgi:DNA adenine methylase